MIASPCTNICDIDEASGLCIGCLRTLNEIAMWGNATDEQREATLQKLLLRKPLVKPKLAC